MTLAPLVPLPERVGCLVLGGGIAGAATAYHLARRGERSVLLYEPKTPNAGASGRAAGILTDQQWNEWDVEVARETVKEYEELSHRHPHMGFARNGFLRWTTHPLAAEAIDVAYRRMRRWGVSVDRIGPADLRAAFPWGRFDDVLAGLRGTADAVVTPSATTDAYLAEARDLGADVWFGDGPAQLRAEPSGFQLRARHRTIAARTTVVAAGAWSKALLRSIGQGLALTPYRVQAATLRPPDPPPERFPSGHDLDTDVYFRPEGPGRVLAGDGTERVEADPDRFVTTGDPGFVTHLAESVRRRLPGWEGSELIRAWAGVCTATPDRRPHVGAVDPSQGLYCIVGFNGYGVMRAGGAARRLVDLLVEGPGGRASDRLVPVDPRRFPTSPPDFPPHPGFTLEGGDEPRF